MAWEIVEPNTTFRRAVPGGWIYRYTADKSSTMAFVPEPTYQAMLIDMNNKLQGILGWCDWIRYKTPIGRKRADGRENDRNAIHTGAGV